MTGVLIKKLYGDTDTHRRTAARGRRQELGIVLPQARGHQGLLASTSS